MKCQKLLEFDNGSVTCSLRDDGIYSYEDTCTVTCNSGYTLTGSGTKTCLSNGSWSGMDVVCGRGKAVKITNNILIVNCVPQHQYSHT